MIDRCYFALGLMYRTTAGQVTEVVVKLVCCVMPLGGVFRIRLEMSAFFQFITLFPKGNTNANTELRGHRPVCDPFRLVGSHTLSESVVLLLLTYILKI